jgi:hypothetical protein
MYESWVRNGEFTENGCNGKEDCEGYKDLHEEHLAGQGYD